jgi:hypothetical protein
MDVEVAAGYCHSLNSDYRETAISTFCQEYLILGL